jgi:uncharacterized protein (DUF1501 family)
MSQLSIATRRQFLSRGLGIVGVGSVLPNYLIRSALAGPATASSDRIVVALLLTGGPDGLSLVPPFAQDEYYRHRKVLAYQPNDVLKLNDEVGLHPRLVRSKRMFDDGRMSVVLGAAYPNVNLSHFISRDVWEAGDEKNVSGKPGATGWLGRFVDYACKGNPDPTLSIAVGPGKHPLIVTGKDHSGVGFSSPDSFRFTGASSPDSEAMYAKLNGLSASANDDLQFVAQTAIDANAASARLSELAANYSTPVAFPDTQFGNSVRIISGLINGGLSARAYYAAQGIAVFGGYDTHADQVRRLDGLLDELDQSISALYEDLARCGNEKRVLTYTFSEFGRRVQENFSGGTDHGLAQPIFVFGSGVKGGVHGKQPSLAELDERGNLKMELDFRSVYAAILERWLGVPSEAVLETKYPLCDCLA